MRAWSATSPTSTSCASRDLADLEGFGEIAATNWCGDCVVKDPCLATGADRPGHSHVGEVHRGRHRTDRAERRRAAQREPSGTVGRGRRRPVVADAIAEHFAVERNRITLERLVAAGLEMRMDTIAAPADGPPDGYDGRRDGRLEALSRDEASAPSPRRAESPTTRSARRRASSSSGATRVASSPKPRHSVSVLDEAGLLAVLDGRAPPPGALNRRPAAPGAARVDQTVSATPSASSVTILSWWPWHL